MRRGLSRSPGGARPRLRLRLLRLRDASAPSARLPRARRGNRRARHSIALAATNAVFGHWSQRSLFSATRPVGEHRLLAERSAAAAIRQLRRRPHGRLRRRPPRLVSLGGAHLPRQLAALANNVPTCPARPPAFMTATRNTAFLFALVAVRARSDHRRCIFVLGQDATGLWAPAPGSGRGPIAARREARISAKHVRLGRLVFCTIAPAGGAAPPTTAGSEGSSARPRPTAVRIAWPKKACSGGNRRASFAAVQAASRSAHRHAR